MDEAMRIRALEEKVAELQAFIEHDKKYVECPLCYGTGTITTGRDTEYSCWTCDGSGKVER